MTPQNVPPEDDAEGAGLSASVSGQAEVSADLTTSPSAVSFSQTSEGGVWNLKQASHDFKVRIESQRTLHELQQDADDQAARRFREKWLFVVMLSIVVVLLGFGLSVGTFAENSTTRSWAQGVVSALVGVIGGALAGYAVGKNVR